MPIHVWQRDSHSFNQNFTMFFTCRIRPMCPKTTWSHNIKGMGIRGPLYNNPLENCGHVLDMSRASVQLVGKLWNYCGHSE